jgi:MFS family permease
MNDKRRSATSIVGLSAVIVIISVGTRQSLGLFLAPISADLGVGREVFSLAIAIQSLIFGLPFVGILADRYGPRWVVVGGGLLYATSLALLAFISAPIGLYLGLGVLAGIALSCTGYVVILGAIAQVVPVEKRSTSFGIVTAAGSVGMLAVVPGVQWTLNQVGWQKTFIVMALFVASIALIALALPSRPGSEQSGDDGSLGDEPMIDVLKKAGRHSGYLLLTAGFFVCGFHVAFIATHLPAFLADNGVASMIGAVALALIGFANIFGSYTFGALGDHYRKKYLLSFLYFGRSVVITLFILFPITNVTALIFSAGIGFLWLATVPLTSGTIAQIFGSRYLSTLYGIVFFSHQIGAFLGVWLGGRVSDNSGSYTHVWLAAIALGIVAGLLHLPITDRPLQTQTAESIEVAA